MVGADFQSDAALVRSLVGGDAGAHRIVWDRYAPLVRRIARRTFAQAHDVDDVTQEVFLRFFRRVEALRKPESLGSFVAGFAFRVVQSERRKRRTTKWLELTETGTLAEGLRLPARAEARFALAELQKVLGALSPRETSVLLQQRVDGMTLQEIADAQGLSLATIKRALQRASTKVGALDRDDGPDTNVWRQARRAARAREIQRTSS